MSLPADPSAATWSRANDTERRDRTNLYVAVYQVDDPRRRARVRRLLAAFGVEVAPAAFEVPTSAAGARVLERALALELAPEDCVRVYPVCARCRAEIRLWGDGELAGLPAALIF